MIPRMARDLALVASLGLSIGCADTGPPGAGLTSGPPPSGSNEKPGSRTDLPTSVDPGPTEPLGPIGDRTTSGGTGARGGGDVRSRPEQPAGGNDSTRATPPTIEAGSPNSAAGATKPAEAQETATPEVP